MFQIRNGEDDATVFVLQDISLLAVVQTRYDDVATLDQTDAVGRFLLEVFTDETRDPWAGGIDQRAGANGQQAAVAAFQMDMPQPLAAPSADAASTRMNVRALFPGSHGVEHHQAGIVHPAVGVFETAADFRFQRAVSTKAQAARGRQAFTF